jgi:hypothetical protein
VKADCRVEGTANAKRRRGSWALFFFKWGLSLKISKKQKTKKFPIISHQDSLIVLFFVKLVIDPFFVICFFGDYMPDLSTARYSCRFFFLSLSSPYTIVYQEKRRGIWPI